MLCYFLEAGFTEDLFWKCTPRRYRNYIRSYDNRLARERVLLLDAAWCSGMLPNFKKVPDRRQWMMDNLPRKPETQEQKLEKMRDILNNMGGVVPKMTWGEFIEHHKEPRS